MYMNFLIPRCTPVIFIGNVKPHFSTRKGTLNPSPGPCRSPGPAQSQRNAGMEIKMADEAKQKYRSSKKRTIQEQRNWFMVWTIEFPVEVKRR